MKNLLLVILACLFCCGCGSCPLVPTPAPIDPRDATTCPGACMHLRQLGCEEGQPLPDGTTCEVFCERTQAAGHALRPSCVMQITTCAELESRCSQPR